MLRRAGAMIVRRCAGRRSRAGNGGESRKSFHGYPDGFAQLIDSPETWHITPMQAPPPPPPPPPLRSQGGRAAPTTPANAALRLRTWRAALMRAPRRTGFARACVCGRACVRV
jgi:hypothetical protein